MEICTIGAPFGRTVALSTKQFGLELSKGRTDAGGKLALCFLTFLSSMPFNIGVENMIKFYTRNIAAQKM